MKLSLIEIRKQIAMGLSLGLLLVSGCSQGEQESKPVSAPPPATVDVHNHPTEGPHHGSLIELGNEEYHAELVHDEDAGTVTFYLLDSSAKNAVPIEAATLLVNLTHDGQAEQFSLAAHPQVSDPSGKASRFNSSDAELAEELDHEGVEAQLVVSIGGKQYRGEIHHDHDHEGHGHEGHGH